MCVFSLSARVKVISHQSGEQGAKSNSFIYSRSARESCLLALEVTRRSGSILQARCDFIKATWSGPSSFSAVFTTDVTR